MHASEGGSLGGRRAGLDARLREASSAELDARLAKMKAWLEENAKLTKNLEMEAEEPVADFKDIIVNQKSSSDACSARLLEAKRDLDTLSREMVQVSGNIEAQMEIQKTETENLKISEGTVKQIEAKNKELDGKCDATALEAEKEAGKYEAELEELRLIAKPAARHQEALKEEEAHPEEGLALVSFNRAQCMAFVAFEKKKQNTKRNPWEKLKKGDESEQDGPEDDDDKRCGRDAVHLQSSFTKAYRDVTNLQATAKHRAGPEREECHEGVRAQLSQELTPLLSQREGSTKRLEEASAAVPVLRNILDNSGERVEGLKEHLVKLKRECIDASGATKHLVAIRALIVNLEHCPGQSNLQLEVPAEKEEETEQAADTEAAAAPADD